MSIEHTTRAVIMSGEDDVQPRVAAVAIKLPPFWPSDPNICLRKWRHNSPPGVSITRGQCSSTLWHHYTATLTEIRDLILTPPAENQYTVLKEQLIQRTATSQQQRIQQLLTAEELGDRKPTQFLHRL